MVVGRFQLFVVKHENYINIALNLQLGMLHISVGFLAFPSYAVKTNYFHAVVVKDFYVVSCLEQNKTKVLL